MKLIAGIGNPSAEYEFTRHNAGFMALDQISSDSGIGISGRKHKSLFGRGCYCGEDVLLVKPLTFVNLSGAAIRSFIKYYPILPEDILVIHDDMDISLGRIKIKSGGGAAGHKGVESVIADLGTDKFPRIRICIDSGAGRRRGAGFVLGRFRACERKVLNEVLGLCVEAAREIIQKGLQPAMNRFNQPGSFSGQG